MYVFLEKREELVPGIWEYRFHPDHAVDFVPGQYVDLFLPDVTGDPRGGSRTFSLTTLPAEPSISFITKHFQQQSPYKQVLQALPIGGQAWISDAMGDLVLPKSTHTPLVFVAGGIGMASYASMLRDLILRKEERLIFLFYYLRSRRERIFKDLTDAYPLQLNETILAPNTLTAQEIKDTTSPDALIYLSGSQTFVENLRKDLEKLGTPRSQIVFDYYDGYTEL